MTVYVEYVLVENFLLDGILLYLAFSAAKVKCKGKKICFAALLGAVFAATFPLIPLPAFWGNVLKITFGVLLCLLALPRLKNTNDCKAFALVCAFFFLFSCAFAGALFALYERFPALENGYIAEQLPLSLTLVSALAFLLILLRFIGAVYKKRAFHEHVYDCVIEYENKRISLRGFLDSGNLAKSDGVPVCFLTPDVAFDLWEREFSRPHGEITVQTLGGEKTLPLFEGYLQIRVKNGFSERKRVYFSPTAHIVSRDYKLLLQADVLNERSSI